MKPKPFKPITLLPPRPGQTASSDSLNRGDGLKITSVEIETPAAPELLEQSVFVSLQCSNSGADGTWHSLPVDVRVRPKDQAAKHVIELPAECLRYVRLYVFAEGQIEGEITLAPASK